MWATTRHLQLLLLLALQVEMLAVAAMVALQQLVLQVWAATLEAVVPAVTAVTVLQLV